MATSHHDPPKLDEIEVSVFGPGYGEAIALHVGEGKWILVDSCIEPDSELPAALDYLHCLNVDVENAVKLIVATHWHDDHICGLGTVFDKCKSAAISISSALDTEEFLALPVLYREPVVRRSSGLDEFVQVLQILDARKEQGVRFNSPRLALADRLLFHDHIRLESEAVEAKVFALSPSDASLLQAKLAFAELLPKEGPVRRVASPTPNHASVVLWIEVDNHRILLGADLERTADPRTGWSVILSDSAVICGKAGVFKVPHHGSENAHHETVWSVLLLDEPFAVVTPFRKGNKSLPTPTDINRINRLTSRAYATAPVKQRQRRWRNRVVSDYVKDVTRDIRDAYCGWGHVRLRTKINGIDGSWQVELFGEAYALSAS
jgi:hypothetical protein